MQMKPIMHSFEQASYPIRQVDTTRDSQLAAAIQRHADSLLRDAGRTARKSSAKSAPRAARACSRCSSRRRTKCDVATAYAINLPITLASAQRDSAGAQRCGRPCAAARGPSLAAEEFGASRMPAGNGNASAGAAASASHAALLSATVRLIVEDAQGRSFGTGTVVDTRSGEALVITCAHLFRETKGKAPVKADLYEAAGDGVRVVGHATGQVLSYDLTRDIALVSLRVDRPVGVVATWRRRSRPSSVAIEWSAIGCSNGQDPTVLETRVTSLDRYQGPPNIEASGAPAIGRSGGGLFNVKNELVGVCNNADPEGNEGIYAGLESIHDQLDRLGLKEIYAKPGSAKPDAAAVAGQTCRSDLRSFAARNLRRTSRFRLSDASPQRLRQAIKPSRRREL